jgi:hypothetical protein
MNRIQIFCAVLAAAAVSAAFATSAAAASQPGSVSAKVTSCVSGARYDDRKLDVKGRMRTIGSGGDMQIRFDVYQRFNENNRYTRIKSTGLSTWVSNTEPDATSFARTLNIRSIETAATYKVRVRFRWLDSVGQVVRSASKRSLFCKQKTRLPDIVVRKIVRYPGTGGNPNATTTYAVTVYNKGYSSVGNHASVGLTVNGMAAVGGPAPQVILADYILPRMAVTYTLSGPDCAAPLIATFDPLNQIRELNKKNNTLTTVC